MKFFTPAVLVLAIAAQCGAISEMTPKGVFSADKSISVFAPDVPGDDIGFRTPLLHFANNIFADLKRTFDTGKPPPRISPILVIRCGDGLDANGGFTNDPSVKVTTSLRNGERQHNIYLPAPGYSDRAELAHAIAKSYFGAWGDVPDWFVAGALRQTDVQNVIRDTDAVLEEWRAGFLPPMQSLCNGEGDDAADSFTIHWMRDSNSLHRILDTIAAGEEFSASLVAEELAGSRNFAAQEAALDEQLLKLNRAVLNPGNASPRELNVFSSHLELYPAVFDLHFGDGERKISFRKAIACRKDPIVRMAALLKMRDLPLRAVGRGDALQNSAIAYTEFLKLLATGAEEEALNDALDAAEALLAAAKETKKAKNVERN